MFLPKLGIRRLTACMLLASYGSVGVFGYGLHALWHVHHHHHAGHGTAANSSCSHQCCSNKAPQAAADSSEDLLAKLERVQLQRMKHADDCKAAAKGLTIGQRDIEESCPICLLLSQAQVPLFSIYSGVFVGDLHVAPPGDEILRPLFVPLTHLARGPPADC